MIERIQLLIDYYNLSASNFADKIDVPRSSISHLLSGRNKPSLDFVMKVVEAFKDVDLNWIVYGKGTFPNKGTNIQEKTKIKVETLKTERPTLFSEVVNKETKEKKIEKPIKQEKPENTINAPQVNTILSTPFSANQKKLKKVVLLYDDGSFEEYNQ